MSAKLWITFAIISVLSLQTLGFRLKRSPEEEEEKGGLGDLGIKLGSQQDSQSNSESVGKGNARGLQQHNQAQQQLAALIGGKHYVLQQQTSLGQQLAKLGKKTAVQQLADVQKQLVNDGNIKRSQVVDVKDTVEKEKEEGEDETATVSHRPIPVLKLVAKSAEKSRQEVVQPLFKLKAREAEKEVEKEGPLVKIVAIAAERQAHRDDVKPVVNLVAKAADKIEVQPIVLPVVQPVAKLVANATDKDHDKPEVHHEVIPVAKVIEKEEHQLLAKLVAKAAEKVEHKKEEPKTHILHKEEVKKRDKGETKLRKEVIEEEAADRAREEREKKEEEREKREEEREKKEEEREAKKEKEEEEKEHSD